MRKLFSMLVVSFLVLPVMAYATWQVADPFHGTELNQELQPAKNIHKSDIPGQYQTLARYSFYLHKGWLKNNVVNMAKQVGWTVNWKAYRNYRVEVKTQIAGENFPDVLTQLLSHYPLNASFNKTMREVTISNSK